MIGVVLMEEAPTSIALAEASNLVLLNRHQTPRILAHFPVPAPSHSSKPSHSIFPHRVRSVNAVWSRVEVSRTPYGRDKLLAAVCGTHLAPLHVNHPVRRCRHTNVWGLTVESTPQPMHEQSNDSDNHQKLHNET